MLLQPKHLTRRPMVMALSDADVIGDPFGGPASGSREKSKGLGMVIGVVASVMTAGAGFMAFSAAQGMTLGNLAAGAMMTGGVMSGVGTVTGNTKLAKMGGYLSLAGGLTSGISDVVRTGELSSFGDTLKNASAEFGEKFSTAIGAGSKATEAGKLGLEASSVAGESAVVGNVADNAAGITTLGDNVAGGVTASNVGGAQGLKLAGSGGGATLDLGGNLANAGQTAGGSGSGLLAQGGGSSGNAFIDYQKYMDAKNAPVNFMDNPMKWANQNQGLLSMGTKLVGAAMDESGEIDQEKLALQTDQWATQKDMMAQQTANINGGVVFLDPTSPNYATAAANAQAAGRTVKTIGINQNAGPVQLNNGFMASSTPQQQATQRA